MSNVKGRIIIPVMAWNPLTDDEFLTDCNAVGKGMDGNDKFPAPPIPIASFKAGVAVYADAISTAKDGSKTAIAIRKRKRDDVTIMMRILGHYVETTCNGDMGVFLSSGFVTKSPVHAPPQPLDQPKIDKIEQGSISGQMLVSVMPVLKARHYDLRYAAEGAGGVLGAFSMITLPSARQPVVINGLTVQTNYAFSVRAYGKAGYTDWSAPLSRICI
jgi:hypothetical protein